MKDTELELMNEYMSTEEYILEKLQVISINILVLTSKLGIQGLKV